jgi:hypothetical protein
LKAGHRVVATGRNVEKVRNALRDTAGENLEVLQLDVSDAAQVTTAVDQAVKKFGRIDVVLNNAGYSLLGNFEELNTQDIERQFATNFWGVLYVMRTALPVMRKQRSGHIINMTEISAEKMWSPYAGTQPGDPDKLGEVLVKLAGMETPPRLFVAGADGIAAVAPTVEARLKAVHAFEELSNSTKGSF